MYFLEFQWLSSEESAHSAEDAGDSRPIPESETYPGEENGNPLQYSCPKIPMDREGWQATVHGHY